MEYGDVLGVDALQASGRRVQQRTDLVSGCRDVNIRELARDEFVEGFADRYGLVKGTGHRTWELYIQWLESAWMREDGRYNREGKGYGMGFAAG